MHRHSHFNAIGLLIRVRLGLCSRKRTGAALYVSLARNQVVHLLPGHACERCTPYAFDCKSWCTRSRLCG